jgi:hypothetical protein
MGFFYVLPSKKFRGEERCARVSNGMKHSHSLNPGHFCNIKDKNYPFNKQF